MKIMIVKTSAIGDVTHTLPALSAIRKRYPNACITWLVEEASAEILKGHIAIDRVLVCRRKKWIRDLSNPLLFGNTFNDIRRFIQALRDTEYDLVIDFQGLLKSAVWVFLSKGKQKVGFGQGMAHAELSYLFYNRKVPAVSMDHHAVERELMLLKAIGVPCQQIDFGFPVEHLHRQKVKSLLHSYNIWDNDHFIAINPMARWDTKLWENRKFARVADLVREKGFKICFTGGHNDFDEIEKIRSMMAHDSVNLAGKTSLKTLAALYEIADLLLTTDTGPMHIAAAIGTPVVAIFGPTSPMRTGPFGDGHVIVQTNSECAPCFKRVCPTRACMEEISVETVGEILDKMLSNT